MANNAASKRSNIPPCPGKIVPESLMFKLRLNNDSSKIVIAPKQWFTDSNINTTDLIPSNWIRI